MSNRNRLLLLISLAVITALFSAGAALKAYSGFNLQVSLLFQSASNDLLQTVLYWLAYINGDWRAAILVVLAGLVIWWRGKTLDAVFLAAAGLISWFNEVLKAAFNLPRPSPELVQIMVVEHSAGYPSGHSFFSLMFYGFIAFLAMRNIKSGARWAVLAGCIIMILAVGVSRIYLGVHWLSDVTGGYLFGGFFLAGLIRVYDIMANKYKKAAGEK